MLRDNWKKLKQYYLKRMLFGIAKANTQNQAQLMVFTRKNKIKNA